MNMVVDIALRAVWIPTSQAFSVPDSGGTSSATARVGGTAEDGGEIAGGTPPFVIVSMQFLGGPPTSGLSLSQSTTTVTNDTVAITAAPGTTVGAYAGTIRAIVSDSEFPAETIQVDLTYTLDVEVQNQLAATIGALSPASWWQLDEASGDLLDSGSSSFPLVMSSAGNENFQLPGLAVGAPRVYGTWNVTNFNYGNARSKNNEGYDFSTWTSGGIGVFALLGNHVSNQYPLAHYADLGTGTRVTIYVEPDGTVHGQYSSSGFGVDVESVAGAYTFGDRAYFYVQFDGVLPKLYMDGVDISSIRNYTGAGIGPTSTPADCVAASAAPGAGHAFLVGNNSSGGVVNQVQCAIFSMPHLFYNNTLSGAEILSVYAAANYGVGHNDYLEYTVEKLGRAKLYAPLLDSYGASTSIIPVLTQSNTISGNPRFQAGTVAAVEADTVLTATAYAKKQWDMTGSDDDAYLRNNASGTEVPLVETTEAGLVGTIGVTTTWVDVSGAGAPNNVLFDYSSNTTADRIRMWVAAGVGSEGQLNFQVWGGGVVVYQAWTDTTILAGITTTLVVVKETSGGSGYKFYINGIDDSSNWTETVNTDDTLWLGDCYKGISGFNSWFGGIVDWEKVGHEAFYLDSAWDAADVAEHFAAQYGTF